MKKMLSLVIALSMIFTLFAGCGSAAVPDPVSEPDPIPESSEPEPEPEPVPLAVEGTIKEVSDNRIVVALGDGTDFVLDTAGLSDLDVRAGDTVRVEYTGAVGSAVAAKVEVTARAETFTVTGVVVEISSGFVFLTLEDGTDAALKTTTLEDYDVQVGDAVTIEYLEDGSVVSVEVTKAAGSEVDTAASAAPDSFSSSQAAAPETAAPAASSSGGSSSNSSSSSSGDSSSGSGGSSYDGMDLNAWFFQYMAPYMEEVDEDEDDTPSSSSSKSESKAEKKPEAVKDAGDVNEAVRLTNIERAKEKLPEVKIDLAIMDMAALRAEEITEKFAHERPDDRNFYSIFEDNDWEYSLCAENIAAGNASAAETINQWMNSPGHRANILRDGVTKIGIGYCYDSNTTYQHYWVMLLATPKENAN